MKCLQKKNAIIAMAILFCGVFAPAVAEVYIESDAPSSLANGKITFDYDSSGKITQLRMNPEVNEMLCLSGDTLDFADGAKLMPGQNGISCISNAIMSAGTLQIGVANMSYNGSLLKSDTYTTMFRNVNINDISPISSDSTGVQATGSRMYYPYHIVRGEDTLRVEFQAVHETYIKCCQIELRQNENDIEGKIINSGNYNNHTNCLGLSLFEFKDVSATSYDYGMKQLTIGPRREEFIYRDGLLSENGTVVAKNTSLEDLEICYAAIRGGYNGCKEVMCVHPHHISRKDGVLSAQFFMPAQNASTPLMKCVKVEFSQSGADVVAKYGYAKYKSWKDGYEYNFDNEGTSFTELTKELYEKNKNEHGYGIDMIVMRRTSRNRLALPVPGYRDIDMPLTGGGCDVIFDAGTNPGGPTQAQVTRVSPALYGKEFTTLTTEYALKDIAIVGGRIGGASNNKAEGRETLVSEWRNDGKTASCQIHSLHGKSLKGIDVELRQNGNAVEIRCATAMYHESGGTNYFGRMALKPDDKGYTEKTVATSPTAQTYALLWVEWDARPHSSVYAAAGNTMTDTRFVIKGDVTHPIDFHVMNLNALPQGKTECFGDAGLHFAVDSQPENGISQGASAMVMHPGTRLYQSGANSFRWGVQAVSIDAATLYAQYPLPSNCYANNLTLLNGAVISCSGGGFRAGYQNGTGWKIAGEGVVSNDADITVFSNGASERLHRFDVADTVPGEGVDFVQNGDICNSTGNYINGGFIKDGAGTMMMNGSIYTTNVASRITGGTLLLNKSGATVAGVDFTFDGGSLALAAETSNEAGVVTVSENASLVFGDGASLSLSRLSISEGAVLTLAGNVPAKGLKVAISPGEDELGRIVFADGRGGNVICSSSGYIRVQRGTVISIR